MFKVSILIFSVIISCFTLQIYRDEICRVVHIITVQNIIQFALFHKISAKNCVNKIIVVFQVGIVFFFLVEVTMPMWESGYMNDPNYQDLDVWHHISRETVITVSVLFSFRITERAVDLSADLKHFA